jgi:hypothetical protein
MSVEVDVVYHSQHTLAPGADAWWIHTWGSHYNRDHWQRMTVSPDNFPASIQIVEEWAFTDDQNVTHLEVHYRNNSTNTVVYRAKGLVAPNA